IVFIKHLATIEDGGKTVHLWQQNMEAILVEAQFGWVLRDKDAFVLYKDAVADTEATAA
ncbi:Gp15 family protein, partial [human gut metagenome]